MGGLVLTTALPSLLRAARTLARRRRVNGDVLDASTLALLAIRGNYSAAALLTLLRSLGDFIVTRSVVTARRSVRDLVPSWRGRVRRVEERERVAVPVTSLAVGHVIAVGAGEQIPVDGTVLEGEALVNQQTMTGEAMPAERRVGDPRIRGHAGGARRSPAARGPRRARHRGRPHHPGHRRGRRAEVRHPGVRRAAGRPGSAAHADPGRTGDGLLAQPGHGRGDPGRRLRHRRARRHSHRDRHVDPPRDRGRDPDQRAARPGSLGPGQHRRLRQDRDPHLRVPDRQPRRRLRPRSTTRAKWCVWPPRPSAASTIPLPGPSRISPRRDG